MYGYSTLHNAPRSSAHTNQCRLTGDYDQMHRLNLIEQDYILLCPHPDHDSVRQFMGYKRKLEQGKLVRIHD